VTSKTVGELIRLRAEEQGASDFFVCDDERLTYADADRRSRALGRRLVEAGVGRSSRVGILFPTGVDFVVTWLAINRIGAATVPVSTFSKPDELRQIITSSDTNMLLGVGAYKRHDYVRALGEAFRGLDLCRADPISCPDAPSLRSVFLSGGAGVHPSRDLASFSERESSISDHMMDAIEADVRPDDRMVIVYTSGSSGDPKGVVHQHGALLAHLENLSVLRGLRPGVKLFSNSPLFWIGGISYNLAGVLVAGATLLCSDAPDAGEALDFIERERPDLVNGYVHSIADLVSHPSFQERDFSSIRSGNLYPMLPHAIRPADPGLRHNMLGLTETGGVCLMCPDESDLPERYRGSFGKPVPDLEARVVDPASGHETGPGELGELWLRGPFLMEGYYGKERHQVFSTDQWYPTGDLFCVDSDGFFYFKGRRNEVIKTRGANVSPREIEPVMSELCGGLPVVVFGVPDAEQDEMVAAAVLASTEVKVDFSGILEEAHSRLSSYKVPSVLIRIEPNALPKLSSGKPDLHRLREIVRGR